MGKLNTEWNMEFYTEVKKKRKKSRVNKYSKWMKLC